jgi:acyl phosphate:glycerol-3-phosphate acyltransferase
MPSSLSLIAALAIGYLLGSIPFGLILTRFAGLGDLRAIGSGNIGATNVLRTGRRDLAAATLVADGLKGTVAVLVAAALFGPDGAMIAGLGAFLGHVFPIWLKFKGGKGVATYLGVLIGLALPGPAWPAVFAFIIAWAATAYFTRYSSLSALVASLVTPIVLIFVFHDRIGGLFVVLTAILWWRHAENIRRLIAGSESRIGAAK